MWSASPGAPLRSVEEEAKSRSLRARFAGGGRGSASGEGRIEGTLEGGGSSVRGGLSLVLSTDENSICTTGTEFDEMSLLHPLVLVSKQPKRASLDQDWKPNILMFHGESCLPESEESPQMDTVSVSGSRSGDLCDDWFGWVIRLLILGI